MYKVKLEDLSYTSLTSFGFVHISQILCVQTFGNLYFTMDNASAIKVMMSETKHDMYNVTDMELYEDPRILLKGATNDGIVIFLTVLFFVVGAVGIVGNLLVIFAVVCSHKMRTSMTNLLITNLAIADLVIMLLGIPEIIQFMMNKGWTYNDVTCRVNRFVLVTSLYGSVLTLMSLCVER